MKSPAKAQKLMPGKRSYAPTSSPLLLALWLLACFPALSATSTQVETIDAGPPSATWLSHGTAEGHLNLGSSPAAAFAPDSSSLALIDRGKIPLMNLAQGGIRSVLKPRFTDITDLEIRSVGFISPTRLFVMAHGLMQLKQKGIPPRTPLLGFQWLVDQDSLYDKLNAIGGDGPHGPVVYFHQLGYLGFFRENHFDVWNPNSRRGGRVDIPELTRQANLFSLSPDGHWLLLAQIEGGPAADPVVVELKEHKLIESLRGHHGTVLGMTFSADGKKVVTACEDGKVRIFLVPGWQPSQTLEGHSGPVHWAEFSREGNFVVSGGEDRTVRVWSATDGKLLQVLSESRDPVLTVAFSPDSKYIAASTQQSVQVWERQ